MHRASLMRHNIVGLAALALLLGGVSRAQAGFVQLTSASQLNSGDTTAIYTGSDGDVEASPYSITAGGNTLTFTTADGGNMVRADQGNSWNPGAFPNGTKLLVSVDPNSGIGSAITITFSTGVPELGLSVQQSAPTETTFTATVSGTAPSLMGTVVVPDTGGNGSLGFIGFAGTSGSLITSLVISSSDGNSADDSQFAMGPVTFGPPIITVIPEPSTLALAGSAVLGLLAYRVIGLRRRPVS
jgi:hypothetical protein